MDGWIDGKLGGWMDGWMIDVRMMDGWMDGILRTQKQHQMLGSKTQDDKNTILKILAILKVIFGFGQTPRWFLGFILQNNHIFRKKIVNLSFKAREI